MALSDIGNPQAPDPDTLEKLSQIPMDYAGDRYQMLQNVRAMNDDAMQRMQTLRNLNQQQQEANLGQTQAQTAEMQARLPGITADAAGKQRDWNVRQQVPMQDEVSAKIAKIAAEHSDDELKTLNNFLAAKMADPNTSPEDYAKYQKVWQGTAAEQDRRLRAQDALALEDAKYRTATAVAGINKDAKLGVAQLRNQYSKQLDAALAKLNPDQAIGYLSREVIAEEGKGDAADSNKLAVLQRQLAAAQAQKNANAENTLRVGGWTQDATGKWNPPTAVPQPGLPPGRPMPRPAVPPAAVPPGGPQAPGFSANAPERNAPQPNPQPNLPQAAPASAGWPAQPAPAGKIWAREVRTGRMGLIPAAQAESAMQQGYEVQGK